MDANWKYESLADMKPIFHANLTEDAFRKWLDRVYPSPSICGVKIPSSVVLAKCEPELYTSLLQDFLDGNADFFSGEETFECSKCGKLYKLEDTAAECCTEELI